MRWQRSTVRARALARRGFGRARRVSTTRDNKRNADSDPRRPDPAFVALFFFSRHATAGKRARLRYSWRFFFGKFFGSRFRLSRRLTPSTPFHLRHERSLRTIPFISGLPDIAVRTHGFTSAVRPTIPDDSELPANASAGCLAVVTDLCAHGNLEDFMAAEGAPLSVAVKLDLMLQVARGLEALKDARVLWRDLKAKNLLSLIHI